MTKLDACKIAALRLLFLVGISVGAGVALAVVIDLICKQPWPLLG